MSRCSKCGYKFTNDLTVCSFCGAKIKGPRGPRREPLIPVEKPSAFKVASVICTVSGILGILTYLCHLAVRHQVTREYSYISRWDDYMIYFLGVSFLVTIVGLIGLNIRK